MPAIASTRRVRQTRPARCGRRNKPQLVTATRMLLWIVKKLNMRMNRVLACGVSRAPVTNNWAMRAAVVNTASGRYVARSRML